MRMYWAALLVGSMAVATGAEASGRYTAGRRAPPGVDPARYALGNDLFKGKVELSAVQAARQGRQSVRLTALQAALPKFAKRKADLPAMAGRLDAGQLDALIYFLGVRYKIETEGGA